MNYTGIIRKIDDLGRIVLPKELRKELNINAGDDFKIYINNNTIILQKYFKLKSKEQFIEEKINIFSSVLKYAILLIIDDKIINYNNEEVTSIISKIIQTRQIYINNKNDRNIISKNIILNGKIIINPIVVDSDLLGSIIVISNDNIKNMENISKLIIYLIKEYLKNN